MIDYWCEIENNEHKVIASIEYEGMAIEAKSIANPVDAGALTHKFGWLYVHHRLNIAEKALFKAIEQLEEE